MVDSNIFILSVFIIVCTLISGAVGPPNSPEMELKIDHRAKEKCFQNDPFQFSKCFAVYFYNVTNDEAIKHGHKHDLVKLGPYVFCTDGEKYIFDPARSCEQCSANDSIRFPNIGYLIALKVRQGLMDMPDTLKLLYFNDELQELDENVFVNKSVTQLANGYSDEFFRLAEYVEKICPAHKAIEIFRKINEILQCSLLDNLLTWTLNVTNGTVPGPGGQCRFPCKYFMQLTVSVYPDESKKMIFQNTTADNFTMVEYEWMHEINDNQELDCANVNNVEDAKNVTSMPKRISVIVVVGFFLVAGTFLSIYIIFRCWQKRQIQANSKSEERLAMIVSSD